MDTLRLSSGIAKVGPVASGFGGSRVRRRQNVASATCFSAPRAQLCGAEDERRNGAKAAPAMEAGVSKTSWNGVRLSPTQRLMLASLMSGLANVRSVAMAEGEEVVDTVNEAVTSSGAPDLFDTVSDFLLSNPLLLAGSGLVLALPLVISFFKKSDVSATEAYEKLGDIEGPSQLLDIRAAEDVKIEGTPSLKVYRKKAIQVPYSGESEDFAEAVLSKLKKPEDTTIYVLDSYDGNSSKVAKLLTKAGVKAAYPIKGGVGGQSGWESSELPWQMPSKGFSLNFSEVLPSSDTGSIVPVTLGVAAAAGVGFVAVTEAETVLQLVGSAVILQFFAKKLLFAKDRKITAKEIQSFLDTKVAPAGLTEELKSISAAFLPKIEEVKKAAVEQVETTTEEVTGKSPQTVVEDVQKQAETTTEEVTGKPPKAVFEDIQKQAETTTEEVTGKSPQTVVEDIQKQAETTTEEVTGKSPQAAVEEIQKTADSAVGSATDAASAKAEEFKTTTSSVVGEAKDTAVEKTEEAEKKVEDTVAEATDVATEKKEEAREKTEEVVGTATDVATEKKEEAQGKTEEVVDTATDVATEKKEEAQGKTEEVVDTATDVATEKKEEAQGKTEEVVDTATDVATEKKEEAQGKTEEVVDTATDVATEKKEEAQGKTEEVVDTATEKKEEAQSTAGEVVEEAKDVTAEKKGEVQATTEEAADKVSEKKEEVQASASQAVESTSNAASSNSSGNNEAYPGLKPPTSPSPSSA